MKTKEPYFYLELSSISVHRQTLKDPSLHRAGADSDAAGKETC